MIEKQTNSDLQSQLEEIKSLLNEILKKPALPVQWHDIQEVCILLRISKRTLFNLKSSGKISFSQINGKVYFKNSDIQKLLERNYHKAFKHE